MSKHTEGPWAVLDEEADKSYIRIRGTRLGGRYKVANVLAGNDAAADWVRDESRANARLIAAAPDLLEALKACAAVVAGDTMHKQGLIDALELARAAILKATGEQA